MFDSVLSTRDVPRSRLAGAGLSIAVYGVLAVGLLALFSGRKKEPDKSVEVTLFTATPVAAAPPPPPPPPPAGGAQHSVKKTVEIKPIEKKPDTVIEPTVETKPEPTATDTGPVNPGGVVGGVEGGVPGGVIGGVKGGVLGGTLGGTGTGTVVMPFGEGMTRPKQLSGGTPQYSSEAMAARVEGKMLVSCVMTVQGEAQNCNVIKGLPMLDQVVLNSLRSSRFTPITFQGAPVAVRYIFAFNFKLP